MSAHRSTPRSIPRPTPAVLAGLAGVGLIALAAPVRAQTPTGGSSTAPVDTTTPYVLPGVRVAAPMTAVPRPPAPPVVVTQVDSSALQQTQAANAYDLVRRTAGIEVHEQGQGPGFASDAVVRGFTSDHSSDVLLVLDGVPINFPVHGHVEGYADWNVLLPAAMSGLSLIHGPASPLYGDFALGGVVEARTAADASGTAGALTTSSFGDAGGWVRTGRRSADGGMLVALDGRREDGWRQNSAYWLGNGALRGWRRVGAAGRLEGGLQLYGSAFDSPGFVSVAQYNAHDYYGAVDLTDGGDAERVIGHARYVAPVGAGRLDALGWTQVASSSVFLNIPEDGEQHQTQEEDRHVVAGGHVRYGWGPSERFAVGFSGEAAWSRYDLWNTIARVPTDEEHAYDGRYLTGGVFARWRALAFSRLLLDVGARLDVLRYGSLDRLTDAPAWQHDWVVVPGPKVGARYLLGGGTSLLASVSRGFRGAPGVIGEPTRDPLTTWSKELGVEYEAGPLQTTVSLFRLDVDNERIQDPVTREISDAGSSRRQGLSGTAALALGRITLRFDGTLNDATITGIKSTTTPLVVSEAAASLPEDSRIDRPSFHDVPLTPGARVPGVANWFGRAELEATLARDLLGHVCWRFSGPFAPVGEPTVRTQAYGLLDLGATMRLPGVGADLDLEVQNALDTRYPEIRASGFVNPGSPRVLRAGLRFGAGAGTGPLHAGH